MRAFGNGDRKSLLSGAGELADMAGVVRDGARRYGKKCIFREEYEIRWYRVCLHVLIRTGGFFVFRT